MPMLTLLEARYLKHGLNRYIHPMPVYGRSEGSVAQTPISFCCSTMSSVPKYHTLTEMLNSTRKPIKVVTLICSLLYENSSRRSHYFIILFISLYSTSDRRQSETLILPTNVEQK